MNVIHRFRFFTFSLFLAGCPQGSANAVFRLDGGDASDDAEASVAADNDGGGSGALCGVDGRDECGSLSACDANLGCVECRSDDDCPIAAAHCLLGACVGCRPGKTDCPGGQACSSADFECHPRCSGPGTCSFGMACDESSGECVGCLGDSSCARGVCSPDRRECVECVSDVSCPKSKPRCRIAVGQCVRCRSNDDCGLAAPTCDPTTFECRTGGGNGGGATDAGTD
jgi:hypothetical protein